jgi:hypothetical protein
MILQFFWLFPNLEEKIDQDEGDKLLATYPRSPIVTFILFV